MFVELYIWYGAELYFIVLGCVALCFVAFYKIVCIKVQENSLKMLELIILTNTTSFWTYQITLYVTIQWALYI